MKKSRTPLLVAIAVILGGMLTWMVVVQLQARADKRVDPERDECIQNLTMLMELTQMWWELERKPAGAVPTPQDLNRFVRGRRPDNQGFDSVVCPRGGRYLLRSTAEPPQCTHGIEKPASGHHLATEAGP